MQHYQLFLAQTVAEESPIFVFVS